jgi:antitoxin ParD1/3/4
MTSLNISLPKALKDYIQGRVAAGTYSTPSEYIRGLIREDQKRRAQEKLEAALLEGLKSGPASETNPSYWADKRKYLRERHKPARIVE